MTMSGDDMARAYVFLTAPKPPEDDYQTYREKRAAALVAYCHGFKLRFPHVTEAIGIASEPFSEKASSQDFLYVDLNREVSAEEASRWMDAMEELDVLQTSARDVQLVAGRSHEFPMPFNFDGPKFYEYPSGMPMNRAERRRMARDARKAEKKMMKGR